MGFLPCEKRKVTLNVLLQSHTHQLLDKVKVSEYYSRILSG